MTETEPVSLSEEGKLSYEEQMLAGLIPSSNNVSPLEEQELRDRLLKFLERVPLAELQPENRTLVQCMQVFQEDSKGQGILTEDVLLDMLVREKASPETQVKYQELFHKYAQLQVSAGKFTYAISRFTKERQETRFVDAIKVTYDVYSKGVQQGKKNLKGYADARSHLENALFTLDQDSGTSTISEGELRSETEDVLIEYQERKTEPVKFEGVKMGIGPVDDITNGGQPGELGVIGGYTEVGKTFCLLNAAHYACTVQGKNVAIGTAEVLYNQIRRRFFLRHARNPKFGLPHGIDADAYKHSKLTPQEEQGFTAAMEDFKTNSSYGRCFLFQIPQTADLPWINNKLRGYNTRAPLSAFYLDSLGLVHPKGCRVGEERSHFNRLIKEAKQMATNFDNQRGLYVLTPWHANRKSWESALKTGGYTLGSWTDADELERSADFLMWLLKLENSTESREIQAGILKYRDGASLKQFTLYHDFASSYLGTVAVSQIGSTQPTAGVSGTPDVHAARASQLF